MYGQPPWWCLLRQKMKCLDIHHLWARVPTCKCEQTSMRRGETGARGGERNTKKMWQPPPNPQKCQEKKQKAAFLSRKVREPQAEANTRRRSGNSLDTSAHSPHLGGGGGREEKKEKEEKKQGMRVFRLCIHSAVTVDQVTKLCSVCLPICFCRNYLLLNFFSIWVGAGGVGVGGLHQLEWHNGVYCTLRASRWQQRSLKRARLLFFNRAGELPLPGLLSQLTRG